MEAGDGGLGSGNFRNPWGRIMPTITEPVQTEHEIDLNAILNFSSLIAKHRLPEDVVVFKGMASRTSSILGTADLSGAAGRVLVCNGFVSASTRPRSEVRRVGKECRL